ncbi:MAG TPA: archaetidylinositol phosphate synthase [Candidatus Bathyarchaeia archaeon]
MLTKLKAKIQQMLTTEAKAAHKAGLTPNRISVIGIIFAFFSALTYAEWQWHPLSLALATILLLLSGFCDVLDGVVARLQNEATAFGGFLDSLLDRYADAAVYAGIVLGGLCDPAWGLIAIIGALLVSYSRARAEAAGVKMESVGLIERAERIIILAIATTTAIFWLPALNIGIIITAVLSNLTVLQRSVHVYNVLKKKETS